MRPLNVSPGCDDLFSCLVVPFSERNAVHVVVRSGEDDDGVGRRPHLVLHLLRGLVYAVPLVAAHGVDVRLYSEVVREILPIYPPLTVRLRRVGYGVAEKHDLLPRPRRRRRRNCRNCRSGQASAKTDFVHIHPPAAKLRLYRMRIDSSSFVSTKASNVLPPGATLMTEWPCTGTTSFMNARPA